MSNVEKESSVLNKGLLMVVFNVSALGIRFLSNLLLAWFLVPELFGVAALVTTVIVGMMMLSDVGIYDSVIRNEKGEQADFCSTAWYMQIGRGMILYIGILVLSPLFAAFYELPELTTYLYVAGLALPIYGFKSLYMTILQRNLEVLPELKLDLYAQIITATLTILIAYFTGSVWALVVPHVINAIILAIGSHLMTPKSFYSFAFVKPYFKEIISFGKWIFFGTMSAFLIQNIDKIILGKIGSLAELGVYQIAFAFATIFYVASNMMMGKLVYPALSAASRDGRVVFQEKLTDLKHILLPVIVSLLFLCFFISPYFFRFLYPEAYHAAGWIAQYMLLMIWFMVLSDFHGSVFIANNEPKTTAITSLFVVAVRLAVSLAGYYYYDLPGFIIGMAVGSMMGYLVYKLLLSRRHQYDNHYEILLTAFAALFGLIYLLSSRFLPGIDWEQILLSLCFVIVMAIGLLIYYKKFIQLDKLKMA